MIGSTDGMGDPGSEAWAKVTGLATAAVIVGEGRVRGHTDTVRQRADAVRRARAAGHVRAAAADTARAAGTGSGAGVRAAIGGREVIPDPHTLTQMWVDAVNTPDAPGSAAQMHRAERYMRITQPELMEQYEAARARGAAPKAAMSEAMSTAHRNPAPAHTAPAHTAPAATNSSTVVAATGQGVPAATTSARIQHLRNRVTGKGTHL